MLQPDDSDKARLQAVLDAIRNNPDASTPDGTKSTLMLVGKELLCQQAENQRMKKHAKDLLENAKQLQSIARGWRFRFLQLQTEQAEYRAQQEDSLWFRIGRRMGFYK